jgi:DNA-binding NtrC family response regulator
VIEQGPVDIDIEDNDLIEKLQTEIRSRPDQETPKLPDIKRPGSSHIEDTEEIIEESLSLQDKEFELIRKALDKYGGKRKLAARELGISERTLYRKIKQYDIE